MQAHTKELYTDIKQMILQISTHKQTVDILADLNQKIIQSPKNAELKAMRQKVYDIRRRLNLVPDQKPEAQTSNISFTYADILSLSSFSVFAASSAAMIYVQSLEIYNRSGFESPILTTCGSILVVCAASVLRAIKPSRITLALCLYVLSFEGYLLVSGTTKADTAQATHAVVNSEKVEALQLKAESEKESLDKANATYEQNGNAWYKAKYVKPAQDKYISTLNAISVAKEVKTTNDFSLLKIMYRLSLLFLFALSVNFLVTFLRSKL